MNSKHVSCVAILCVRNEALQIARALESYVRQGIEVVVIDHSSTDDTLNICDHYFGQGLIRVQHLPWHGVYDQTAQLAAKEAIINSLSHDWVIHADADEWLQSPADAESLVDGISRVSAGGFNVINFEEFVFIPPVNADIPAVDSNFREELLHYYFFSPAQNRLMRAWRRADGLSNRASGGHRLVGKDVRIAPEPFILRHYIALSPQHALQKYGDRKFSDADMQKGWHANRRNLCAHDLVFPRADTLKRLRVFNSKDFDRSEPKRTHFWNWGQ
jgi:glycosyltransferase involved in cell wall biosynthesis